MLTVHTPRWVNRHISLRLEFAKVRQILIFFDGVSSVIYLVVDARVWGHRVAQVGKPKQLALMKFWPF